MTRAAALAAAALLAACGHGYVALGYDVRTASRGAMDVAADGAGVTGGLAVGIAQKGVGIEAHVQAHDLDVRPSTDRFVGGSWSLELRFAPVRLGRLRPFVHVGPDRAAVLDKQTMALAWGIGVRAGGGAELALGQVGVWVDVAREDVDFGDVMVNGNGVRDALTVGITLR